MKYYKIIFWGLQFICALNSSAQIFGNGIIVSDKKTINEFRNLVVNGPFQIVFSNNEHSDFWIKIETDQNLQQYVSVVQMGLTVYININPEVDIKKISKMVVYVDNRDIHSIALNSTNESLSYGSVHCCGQLVLTVAGDNPISLDVTSEKILADITNVKTTKLAGRIKELDLRSNSDGAIRAFDLNTDYIRLKNIKNAAIEIYCNKELAADNTGRGYVYFKGKGMLKASADRICWEGADSTDSLASKPFVASVKSSRLGNGYNADSLFTLMIARDQQPRRVKFGDTIHAKVADSLNFICLKWYLNNYGYPRLDDSLQFILPTLLMHIDNYENFIAIDSFLLSAVKRGNLQANTYAHSCDRSMIAGKKYPCYYYFFPGSEFEKKYRPSRETMTEVNKRRKDIGLPVYPLLLNGKYF